MSKIQTNKNKLFKLYIIDDKSQAEIGKILGCSQSNVALLLKKFGINAKSRNRGGTHNSFYGKHHTKATKNHLSKTNKGRFAKEKHWNWQGGIRRGHEGGYLRYTDGTYIHRAVMEQKLGRKLKSNEFVHHIDGNAQNNVPENLKIMSNAEHRKLHCKSEKRNNKGMFIRR